MNENENASEPAARGSALIAPSTKTAPAHTTKTAPTHKTRLPPLHMGDWAEANAAKALDAQKRIVMKFGGSSIRDAERVTHGRQCGIDGTVPPLVDNVAVDGNGASKRGL